MKLMYVLLLPTFFFSCSTISILDLNKGFVDDQPEYPVEDDDPFFHEASDKGESFRILITDHNYSVRQILNKNTISRKIDVDGDREQMAFFVEKAQPIRFKDWSLGGVLSIRLNPLTRRIEHQSYELGSTPKTWQSTEYFIQDFSRFEFKKTNLRRFKVRYLWRITKRPGLSKAEARRLAIEYLKSQVKK